MVNIFKSTTWDAYELWVFKISMFALGILVGVYFTNICINALPFIWGFGGAGTVITTLLWWTKINQNKKSIQ
jgi:hypothetical protein